VEARRLRAVGCCDLKHLMTSGYVMSRILRGFGVVVGALVCFLRLGCLVLLLVVFRLRAKAVLELGVLFVRVVEVERLLWLVSAFRLPLVWSSG